LHYRVQNFCWVCLSVVLVVTGGVYGGMVGRDAGGGIDDGGYGSEVGTGGTYIWQVS